MKSNNYITIQGWMVTKLNLSGNELIVYALIFGFSQDDESRFSGSLRYIMKWLNVSSKHTALKALNSLVEKNLIIKHNKFISGVKFCDYSINEKCTGGAENAPGGGAENAPGGGAENAPGGGAESAPHINILDNTIKDNYISDWRKDFEFFKETLRKSVKELLNDKEYIQQQEKFNPNVNIKLTIEKACINYWATEAGWKHKKKSRSKDLDWKSTITNAISSPMNRVYNAKQNQEIISDVSKKYPNAETYKREGYDR